MIKKIMIGLLCAMAGVSFATDFNYKKESNWNQTDSAKIEKGLAAATAAKDEPYIIKYNVLKLIANKDTTNISYNDLKNLLPVKHPQFVCSMIINCKKFNPFIKNVINDPEVNNCKFYITYYAWIHPVISTIEHTEWRKAFINLKFLNKVESHINASSILKVYKDRAVNLTPAEIKADCAVFKRVWYPNISKSEEWKKLLVEIELILKSVE